ncbi:MAG: baseplate J/gp47 family protein, partial [Clostridia bacterium]|nr:baseplate J/gp47 family protein [Clostridia bacterium]
LYSKCDWLLRQAFAQTASGEYLDLHAQQRAVTRKPAYKATGEITFYRESEALNDISIPAGTICSTAGENARRYITTENAILQIGALSVTVPAQAESTGESYNCAAGSVTVMVTAPQGVIHTTNEREFSGGCDSESDDSLRERLKNSYSDISNGANTAFYRELALRHTDVGDANAVARLRGRGTVDVAVFSASNTLPDQQIIDEVSSIISEAREIGTDVLVYAAQEISLPIKICVSALAGYDIQDVISRTSEATGNLVMGVGIGKTLYVKDLHALVKSIEGVDNYKILTPHDDYAVPPTSKLITDGITVSQLL